MLAAFTAIYIASGRGRGLLNGLLFVRSVSAGVGEATPYPLHGSDLLSSSSLLEPVGRLRIDYAIAPAILVVGLTLLVATLAYSRWSARSTILLAYFSSRAFYTAMPCCVPTNGTWLPGSQGAYLLLCAMLSDAAAFAPSVRWNGRDGVCRSSVLFFFLFALYAVWSIEKDRGLTVRAERIANGSEVASAAKPYSYPGLPRAGDVNIPASTLNLVRYVREHTRPREPIWVVTDYVDGAELYFLAERRNSTPYDNWAEVMTKREARILLSSLIRDPPILIVGHGWNEYQADVTDYVNAHWKLETTVEGIDVRRYDSATHH